MNCAGGWRAAQVEAGDTGRKSGLSAVRARADGVVGNDDLAVVDGVGRWTDNEHRTLVLQLPAEAPK